MAVFLYSPHMLASGRSPAGHVDPIFDTDQVSEETFVTRVLQVSCSAHAWRSIRQEIACRVREWKNSYLINSDKMSSAQLWFGGN